MSDSKQIVDEMLSSSQSLSSRVYLQVWSKFKYRGMIALLLLIVFLTYGHALHSPFVFDDIPNIVENPYV